MLIGGCDQESWTPPFLTSPQVLREHPTGAGREGGPCRHKGALEAGCEGLAALGLGTLRGLDKTSCSPTRIWGSSQAQVFGRPLERTGVARTSPESPWCARAASVHADVTRGAGGAGCLCPRPFSLQRKGREEGRGAKSSYKVGRGSPPGL